MARTQQENIINGNTLGEAERVGELESQLGEKEKLLQEMMAKFSRNRQILTSNWEQAETEVSGVLISNPDLDHTLILKLLASTDL